MRQGGDIGTQYRSVIYTFDAAQKAAAMASRESFQAELAKAGYDRITTEIADVPPFYYAEAYHQQYLAKNPNGYCGLGGTSFEARNSAALAISSGSPRRPGQSSPSAPGWPRDR